MDGKSTTEVPIYSSIARIGLIKIKAVRTLRPLSRPTKFEIRLSNRHACRRGLPFPRTICATIHRTEGGRISSWKGYKAVGEGYTICERRLPLNFKNLEQRASLKSSIDFESSKKVSRPPSMNLASEDIMNE